MFIGTKIAVGAFVPDDYVAMYCWANDVVAARLDGAFRPVNLKDVVNWCEYSGKDPTRVMLAIRRRTDPKIIGYLHIQNINLCTGLPTLVSGSEKNSIADKVTARRR